MKRAEDKGLKFQISKSSALPIFSAVLALFALSAFVIKNLMVGADNDEGYGLVLAYRLLRGDKLFLEMWEPHQTSAIITAILMKPYFWFVKDGLDYLNIYMRVVFFAGQLFCAAMLYRMIRTCFAGRGRLTAALLAGVFFCNVPKCIFIPEYSNLHNWFFMLLCVCMVEYLSENSPNCGKKRGLLGAGLCILGDVLAYPSMLLLVPVCLFLIIRKKRKQACGDIICFLAPGAISAAGMAIYVFSYMSLEQFGQVLPYILGDGSHQTTFWGKVVSWMLSFGEIALVLVISALVAAGFLWLLHTCVKNVPFSKKQCFFVCFFGVQMLYQIFCWLFGNYNASYPHTIYIAVMIGSLFCCEEKKEQDRNAKMLMLLAVINYVLVMVLSNWEPIHLIPYLIMGTMGGFLYSNKLRRETISVLCAALIALNAFGYCYLIIGGAYVHDTIDAVNNRYQEGVRKKIYAEYINADIYNTDLQAWKQEIPAGSKVLYLGPAQYNYMLGDCVISGYSTISTPSYDDTILDYWAMNPERYPDVVMVESWRGDIRIFDENSFYRNWIINDFRPSEIIEYPYVTIYKR